MATASLRFGIIGTGNMGMAHARNLKAGFVKSATLTAICDIDEPKLAALGAELDVPTFNRYEALLDSGLVDAVLIATPHYWHVPMTVAAARRKLHVLCEKPLSVTVGAAKVAVEECRKAGVTLGVMFMQRLRPFTIKLKQIVDSGQLGEIFRVSMVGSSWYRTQFYYNSGGWRGTWLGEGGGILMNQAPHSLDQYVWVAGLPKTVVANVQTREHAIEVENTANAILDYGNGKMGYIYATTAESPGVEEMVISGTKGTLVARDGKLRLAKLAMPLDKHLKTAKSGFEAPASTWIDIPVPTPDPRKIGVQPAPGASPDQTHMGVVAQFVKAVRTGAPLVATGEDGVRQLTLCNAIYLSGFTGKPVTLPLDETAVERMITNLARTRGKKGVENLRAASQRELKKVLNSRQKKAK